MMSADDEESYYDLLDVTPTAAPEIIRRAFTYKATVHHPDRGGDPRMMSKLNEAHETLRDPIKREAYDRRLAEARSAKEEEVVEVDQPFEEEWGAVVTEPIQPPPDPVQVPDASQNQFRYGQFVPPPPPPAVPPYQWTAEGNFRPVRRRRGFGCLTAVVVVVLAAFFLNYLSTQLLRPTPSASNSQTTSPSPDAAPKGAWVAVLASLKKSDVTLAAARARARSLQPRGVRLHVLDSSAVATMNPGYWSIVLMPYKSRAAASKACGLVKRKAGPTCYPRHIG